MQIVHKYSLIHIKSTLDQALERLHENATACLQSGDRPLLSPSFTQDLDELATRLKRAANDTIVPKYLYQKALAMHHDELKTLSHMVRDFWMVLRRRTRTERLDPALLALYALPARAPGYLDAAAWLQHGEHLLIGERAARAQGYPPMIYPDPALLARRLARARQLTRDCQQAKLAYDQQATVLRQLQHQAQHHLRSLAFRLKEQTRHLAPPARRDFMRCFGLSFAAVTARDRAQLNHSPSQDLVPIKSIPTAEAPKQKALDPPQPSTFPLAEPRPRRQLAQPSSNPPTRPTASGLRQQVNQAVQGFLHLKHSLKQHTQLWSLRLRFKSPQSEFE